MEASHPPLASRIASLVHDQFNALPARCKPTIHPDGSREWIPMSGIVVVKGMLCQLFYWGSFYSTRFWGEKILLNLHPTIHCYYHCIPG